MVFILLNSPRPTLMLQDVARGMKTIRNSAIGEYLGISTNTDFQGQKGSDIVIEAHRRFED